MFIAYQNNPNIMILDSNYKDHLIDELRLMETKSKRFLEITSDLTFMLFSIASQFINMKEVALKNWKDEDMLVKQYPNNIVVIPIMRAGLSMLSKIHEMIGNNANISFIDYARDEKTMQAKLSYSKMSSVLEGCKVIIPDPMLATGGTLSKCVQEVLDRGVKEEDIISLSVISSPEGVERIHKQFPKIKMIIANLDEYIDDNGFIVPGLGDFGDRCYGKYGK